jgi:beta-lactamase class A
MKFSKIGLFASLAALAIAPLAPAQAQSQAQAQAQSQAQAQPDNFESAFDSAFGTEIRSPRDYAPSFDTALERRIAQLADGSNGRIGVAAVDLATGQAISVLVDQGRWSLTSEFPLLWPVRSQPFSTSAAPVRQGEYMPALELIELMITRSSNPATDALLAAVGGPDAVNGWARRAGLAEFSLDRDIATLVRDDGEFDPARHIDPRDSATPQAMVQLLAGIYQGRWLSHESRNVIIGAMERTRTGTRRIRALMPDDVTVAHKTGSLNNTSSDIGILTAPDGRSIALAIYVTGQGSRANREARIASIARGIYDGYSEEAARHYARADHAIPANAAR